MLIQETVYIGQNPYRQDRRQELAGISNQLHGNSVYRKRSSLAYHGQKRRMNQHRCQEHGNGNIGIELLRCGPACEDRHEVEARVSDKIQQGNHITVRAENAQQVRSENCGNHLNNSGADKDGKQRHDTSANRVHNNFIKPIFKGLFIGRRKGVQFFVNLFFLGNASHLTQIRIHIVYMLSDNHLELIAHKLAAQHALDSVYLFLVYQTAILYVKTQSCLTVKRRNHIALSADCSKKLLTQFIIFLFCHSLFLLRVSISYRRVHFRRI